MTAYEDLSPYTYTEGQPAMLNVGWLGARLSFVTGECEPGVRDALVCMAARPSNVMRGLHDCHLCDQESPIAVPYSAAPKGVIYLGTGEIRVPYGRAIYVAPTLIIHYIDVHSYLPPEAFRRATVSRGANTQSCQFRA